MWETIIGVALGWLLGLISPKIVEAYRRPQHRAELRRSLIAELRGKQVQLLASVYQLRARVGHVDRKFLNWFQDHWGSAGADPQYEELEQLMAKIANLNDHELAAFVAQGKSTAPNSLSLKTHHLPFLEANLGAATMFKKMFHQRLLDIWSRIQQINEEIEQAKFYFKTTFDSSLSRENYRIICKNLEDSYQTIARFSERVIEKIDLLESTKA
jgi:hypothetical protein